jgi:hypothetical protein
MTTWPRMTAEPAKAPPACCQIVIPLRYGIKGRCSAGQRARGKVPGQRTRKSALDTSPAANRPAAVSPMGEEAAHPVQPRLPPDTTGRRRPAGAVGRSKRVCVADRAEEPVPGLAAAHRALHRITPGAGEDRPWHHAHDLVTPGQPFPGSPADSNPDSNGSSRRLPAATGSSA